LCQKKKLNTLAGVAWFVAKQDQEFDREEMEVMSGRTRFFSGGKGSGSSIR
jgi:hypothetical protein